jgi:hypothetical protein
MTLLYFNNNIVKINAKIYIYDKKQGLNTCFHIGFL